MKKLPEEVFYDAMLVLQGKYEIEHVGSTIPHRSKRLDAIEAILHELVHGVCLGSPHFAAEIEGRLRQLSRQLRDEHELTTLRVELRIYDLLGHPMAPQKRRKLLRVATFDGETPSFNQLQAPLSVAEEALATLTAGLIRKTAAVGLEIL